MNFHRASQDKENINPSGQQNDNEKDKDKQAGLTKELFRRRLVQGSSFASVQPIPRSTVILDERPRAFVSDNPQHVPEFFVNIRSFLQKKECYYQIDPFYMENQTEVNERMRGILVDWLIDVNIRFKLLPVTLFLTVNLIDRFLSKETIPRSHVQLVGVAALMIVAKFEEIYPPLLKDYVSVCDSAYTKEQILEMESRILLAINFNLAQTTSFAFLQQIRLDFNFDDKAFAFGQYVIENALFDISLLKYSNHALAAGAVFLISKVFRKDDWKKDFEAKVGLSEKLSKACAKDLFKAMQVQDKSNLLALKRKFATAQYFEMSKYRVEKISSSG